MTNPIPPEGRENAKNALAYLTSTRSRRPDEDGGALLKAALGGKNLEDLLAGTVTLASLLLFMRERDSGISVDDSLEELGAILTRGE